MEITAAAAQATTYTTGKTLAEQINDYLAASKTSIATLASEIPGYSRPTISRYLSGKYEGDISTIEKLLADWLAQHTGEAVELPEPGRSQGARRVSKLSRVHRPRHRGRPQRLRQDLLPPAVREAPPGRLH